MRLDTIRTILLTGTVKNVIIRGNMDTSPVAPYVLLYDDYSINSYFTVDNTIDPFIIEVHYPPGYSNAVTTYIEKEVVDLLHRKVLTDADGDSFQTFATPTITPLTEPNDDRAISAGNDDGTISRGRRFFTPRRGL